MAEVSRGGRVPCPEKKFLVWQMVEICTPSLPQLFFFVRVRIAERCGFLQDTLVRQLESPRILCQEGGSSAL